MKLILLSKGKYAKVDDWHYDELMQGSKWYFDGRYARRNIYENGKLVRRELMHRIVNKTPHGKYTDHIDGDELNNQESNLRLCNFRQNAANQKKAQNKSSPYKGVSACEGRWRSQISFDNRKIYDAMFAEERWAAYAYDLNATALFGEFVRRNFPHAILVVKE